MQAIVYNYVVTHGYIVIYLYICSNLKTIT